MYIKKPVYNFNTELFKDHGTFLCAVLFLSRFLASYFLLRSNIAQSAGAVEYPNPASLQRGKTLPQNGYTGYDTKHSESEVPVMLEL